MQIIKKLDLFVLKNFLTLFLGTFCISLFAVLMQFTWRYVDELIGKGLPAFVLAKFVFYAAEILVPLALPLAVLLASLISFGNMGERLELLAIKASGISLFRVLRPLFIVTAMLAGTSFYFQNVVVPDADNKFMLLLVSIRMKSPELDIPEGVFYSGIDGNNIYVERKDKETGWMYNAIIYNYKDGAYRAHIILADSARLETTADKKQLFLHLYSGEQFENTDGGNTFQTGTSNVPYRRETFVEKHFLIDFDTNLNMAGENTFSSSAKTKGMDALLVDIDSLQAYCDSLGYAYYKDYKRFDADVPLTTMSSDSLQVVRALEARAAASKTVKTKIDIDSVFQKKSSQEQQSIVLNALSRANTKTMNLEFCSMMMKQGQEDVRFHIAEIYQKITMSLAVLLFFFIGAPLGAIIREGGLGVSVVVSVLIFIFYYVVNTAGVKVGREGSIPIELGVWLSTIVLAPIGLFLTVKSNNDSAVFNKDAYVSFFRRLWGIRQKRHIAGKEVIINDPDYDKAEALINELAADARAYLGNKKLKRLSYFVKLYIGKVDDSDIRSISERLEYLVDMLANSRKRQLIADLNEMPIIDYASFRFYRRVRSDMKNIISVGEKLKKDIYGK